MTCSVNPIPAAAKGRLLLGSGTYLAQVPWVVQSNEVNIIGNSAGSTVIQACASGQPNCNSVVFPPGQAILQLGQANMNLFQVTARELAVDCNDVPGVSGIAVLGIQEESVLDLVKASGCRVAGIDIGLGDVADQNGAALSNFNVLYPNGSGCPATVNPGTISTIQRASNGAVSVTLSAPPTPALADGYEVVISAVTPATFNGTYRVNTG